MRYYDEPNKRYIKRRKKKVREHMLLTQRLIAIYEAFRTYKYSLSVYFAQQYADNQNKKRELYFIKYGTEKPTEKKKIKYSKYIVGLSITAVIIYTVAAFLLQKNIGYEVSPTLTTCFYSFFGVELLAMTGIKVSDTINETKFQIHESDITSSTGEDVG